MIQSAVLGSLSIVIGGDISGLDKAAAKAEGIVGKLSTGLNSQVAHLAGYAAAAAGAGAALAAGLIAKSMETIDVQSKLAARLNGTVVEIQSLTHAGNLAGVEMEMLSTSVGKMNQKLAEAARTGQGPAYEALQRLGLSAKAFLDLPVDERLATLADKFKDLGYNTAQQADALKQLGVKGQEMISLFEGGGDGIRNATKDVEAFGVAVSDIDAASIEAANDAWTTARLALTGIGNQLAVALSPLIKNVADNLADAGRETHGFADAIQGGVKMGVMLFGQVQRAIQQNRIELDEFGEDIVNLFNNTAGFIPKTIEKVTNGAITAADVGYHDIEHTFGKLRGSLQAPPTDEEWDKWWQGLKDKAAAAAKEVVDQRKKANAGSGDTGDGMSDSERKSQQDKLDRLRKSIAAEDEQLRIQRDDQLKDLAELEQKKIATTAEAATLRLQIEDKYQKDLQALKQQRFEDSVATEDELMAQRYAKQLADLDEFERNRTYTVEQAAALRRKIEERARLDSVQLQARQYSALAGIVDSAMGDITSLVGDEGAKQFAIFKAISSATALVKGYEAAVSAYAAGNATGIPGMGAIMAAASAVGTAAYIAKLNGVSLGGGGGGGTVAAPGGGDAASAAAAPAPPAAQPQTMFLSLNGSFFGREQVRELAGKLIDFQNDGGKVVLQ
ncbi:hypothetical protein [uncultured Bradyrhizobium sp.]|jgi:hypothetical protein|uniref:hypothetical protein n=1 Tax=uncultured Bradyrhizobium sp. TaxID=199684 RepID=UPI00261EF353|nr:hypothetical protein [uncultured Bradyrhizobium sp.]